MIMASVDIKKINDWEVKKNKKKKKTLPHYVFKKIILLPAHA